MLDPKVAPAPLVLPSELPLFGLPSDFLTQFAIRSLVIQIVNGGALGAMTFQWQQAGDAIFNDAIASQVGNPFVFGLPDPGFAMLTFAAGTYVAATTYTIDALGTVSPGAGAFNGITASRVDVVTSECESVTSQAVTWMQPRAVPPVIAVPSAKRWLADIIKYGLKSRPGMGPGTAGSGDENLRLRAEDAERNLRAIGRSDSRPPDLVDSSTSGTGAGIPQMPVSRSSRGFENF